MATAEGCRSEDALTDANSALVKSGWPIDTSVSKTGSTPASFARPSWNHSCLVLVQAAASEQMIAPGGQIKYTQSPVSLENLIGQMIFSSPSGQKKPGEGGEAPQGAPK